MPSGKVSLGHFSPKLKLGSRGALVKLFTVTLSAAPVSENDNS